MLGKHTLNPGEKAELKAVFDTAGRPGVFRKTVTLSTSAAGQEDFEAFVMTGTVKEAPSAKIQVDPRRVVLEKAESGTVRAQTFSVKNTGTIPLVITKIYSQKSNMIYFDGTKEGNMVIDPEQIKKIELQLKMGSNEKDPEEMIIIVCNARNALKGNYMIMIQSSVK
jgi:hypothetical protein